MKPRRNLFLGSFLVAFSMAHAAHAGILEWKGSTSGLTGGTDLIWNTDTTANWWDGASTINWPALGGTDDDAVFGGTAGTVTITTATANDITFNTTGYILSGGTLTLNGTTPTITNGTGIDATISSVIAGSSGLTKSGAGTLILSGVNTYTGGTTLGSNAGTILATLSTTQNSISTGAVSIGTGSILQFDNTNTTNTTVTVSNVFTGAGTLRLNFAAGTTGRNTSLNGVTGFTGTIRLSNSGSTGDKWNLSTLGTVNAAVQIDSGNTLYAAAGTSTFTGGITVAGGGNSENRGAIRLESGATLGGNISLAGNTNLGGGNSTTSIYSGNILSGAVGTQTLTLGGASGNGDFTISGNIGGGTGTISVTKNTAGTVVLSGVNTYTGSTTLSGGSVLSVNTIGNQSENSSVGAGTTISIGGGSSAGTLRYTGTAKTTNRIINMSGGTAGSDVTIDQSGTGLLKFTSNFSNVSAGITKTLTLQGSTAGTGEISGAIQEGTGGMVTALNKAGSGTWTLSGNNTYTGVTTITAGVLNVANLTNYGVSGALGNRASGAESGSNIGLRFMGGTLQYTGSTAQTTNRQIRIGTTGGTIDASGTGAGTLEFAYTAPNTDLFDTAGARTLTLTGSNTGNNIFAIRLTDQNATTGKTSLIKSGAGTWNLTGSSSYSGSTNITGGVLSVGSTGEINVGASTTVGTSTITGGGRLTVDGGSATFRGAGVTGGNTVILGDASNPGHITVQNNGSLTVNNGQLIMGQGNGSATNNTLAAATLTQTGGNITVNSAATSYIGNYTPATMNISGGTFSHTSNGFVIGTRADASLTLSGTGTANFGTLQMGNSSTTNLVDIHLNAGGILAVSSITQGGSNGVNTFNFDGGTLKARADSATFFTGADNAYVKNGGGTVDTQAFNITIGQALKRFTGATTDALTKTGSGALTLTGANTYGGGTNIENGSIIIGGGNDRLLNTGSVTLGAVSTSGKLILGDGTARNQTLAGISVTGLGGSVVGGAPTNSTLTISTTGSVDYGGVLGGANTNENNLALTKSGSGTLTLSGSSANTYAGLTTISAGTLTLGKTAGINAIAGNISMGSGSTTNLVLAANNQIADTSIITFVPGSGIYSYLNLTGFTDTLGGISDSTGRGVIQNEQTGSGKAATVLTISNSSDYSFNGYFRNVSTGTTGTLGLTKQGAGKQTLSGSLINYTGPTTINAGTLELTGATAFASSVGFGASSTGILQMAGATGTIRGLSTVDTTNNNAIVQNAAGTDNVLTINQAGDTSFGGIIRDNTTSNTLAITKTGAGTLKLTNANTYSGTTTLTTGTIQIGVASVGAVGAITSSAIGKGSINFNGGVISSDSTSARDIYNAVTYTTASTFGHAANNGKLTFSAEANLGTTQKNMTVNSAVEFSGKLTGAGGGITKLGQGTLTLSGAGSDYTGAVTFGVVDGNDGILLLAHSSALGTSAGGLTIRGNNQTGGVQLTGGITISDAISFDGRSSSGTGDIISNLSGNNIVAGLMTGGANGGNYNFASQADLIDFQGGITTATSGRSLNLRGAGDGKISGAITNTGSGTMAIRLQGSGIWELSAANTHVGNTSIAGAGTLKLTHNLALQNSALDTTYVGGGTVDFTSVNTPTIGGLTSAGGLAMPANVTSLTLNVAGTQTHTGNLSGGTSMQLVKSGAGTQVLGGTNSYTGLTTISAGSLQINSAGAIGGTAITMSGSANSALVMADALTAGSGKTLTISGSGVGGFFGALTNVTGATGTSEWQGDVVIGTNATRIGAQGGTLKVSGDISAAAAHQLVIRNSNSGKTILSGTNTYTGETYINPSGGELQIEGGSAIHDSGLVNIANSAGNVFRVAGSETIGALSGGGNTSAKAIIEAGQTLTLSSGTQTFAGVIEGSGALTVNGAVQTLSGTNTYTGATTVTGGRLNINGSITSATTVADIASLGGVGSITGDISLAGTLLPGQGGTGDRSLTINGNVTTTAGSKISFTVTNMGAANHDQLVIGTGSSIGLNNADLEVTFDNALSFTNLDAGEGADFLAAISSNDFTSINATWFKLIDGTTSGMFANVTGNTLTAGELSYLGLSGTRYAYDAGNGQRFWVVQGSTYLVAIPEPRAALLGSLGMLMLLRRRRVA